MIRRVGGESFKLINARVIAISNTDLAEAIKEKSFRDDLYYRLSVIHINIPPLRERKRDIPRLCEYFIKLMTKKSDIKLSDEELNKLLEYEWPGNVRELKNVMERALIIQRGKSLQPSQLLKSNHNLPFPAVNNSENETNQITTLENMERNHIEKALIKYIGNYTQTAKALDISLSTLKRKVKNYNLTHIGK
jgi:transcriptional regulator with PAS, ATPase and Fis domain